MSYIQALVLAIIEGFSEFLPISSTGHMIIASSAMGIAQLEFTKLFTVCIQFGAVLSVVYLYWRRLIQSRTLYLKLLVAFLPAAILGKAFHHQIDALLENVMVVAVSLVLGGLVFLWVDQWFSKREENSVEITYPQSLKVGLFQALAMIPGVSRSGATIVGGLTQGLTRAAAAEFSFLLAIPTMFVATVYKLVTFSWESTPVEGSFWTLLILGNVVAFMVALAVIKLFVSYLTRKGFKLFGYYRIALGLTLIVLRVCGVTLHMF